MEMVAKMWPILQRSTQKISDLVRDMLTYSKRREPELSSGNFNAVISDIFENQKGRAEELQIGFFSGKPVRICPIPNLTQKGFAIPS